MDKKKILDNSQIKRKIKRISLQIIESNINEKEIILAGVEKNGFLLAKELNKEINNLSDLNTMVCNIKIDKKNPINSTSISVDLSSFQSKSIVVIDDVLNSGSTLMYAVKYFLETDLKQLKTAVLVDRNHKKFPIKADFKGVSLSTSLQNHVNVVFNEDSIEAFLH
jgi:pyrimidine operon attenuation protein/uracil phosphoribosyltransferase|tara:strand:+ start:1517 stop:2014 length:498 start_codon:yes stop_codon:yes gene_type:complete